MSLPFDSLHASLEALRRDLDEYSEQVRRFVVASAESVATQDRTISELRDDLHAVANRVESLTRGR